MPVRSPGGARCSAQCHCSCCSSSNHAGGVHKSPTRSGSLAGIGRRDGLPCSSQSIAVASCARFIAKTPMRRPTLVAGQVVPLDLAMGAATPSVAFAGFATAPAPLASMIRSTRPDRIASSPLKAYSRASQARQLNFAASIRSIVSPQKSLSKTSSSNKCPQALGECDRHICEQTDSRARRARTHPTNSSRRE